MEKRNKRMSLPDDFKLVLYAVRSKDGKWYKSRGQGVSGPRWVDGIDAAKIYTKPGPAKSIITWWAKNYPEFGVPDLVEITAREAKVIKQEDRVEKAKQKESEANARYKVKEQQMHLKIAKQRVAEAQEELDRLQKVKEEHSSLHLSSDVLKRKLKYAKRELEDAEEELELENKT